MQLQFRLKTTPIKLPTEMVVAKLEGPTMRDLQARAVNAQREVEHWKDAYRSLADGSCQNCGDHDPHRLGKFRG
jgi:hypothetical protein